MNGYLNLLTGGGFSDVVAQTNMVTVTSNRYGVDEHGNLIDLKEEGSIVFRDGKFSVGVYDNLEGDS